MKESLHPGQSRRHLAFARPIESRLLDQENRTVLVMPLSEYGHLIPTLKLAARLREDGWRVAYMANEAFRPFLEAAGFGCYPAELPPEEMARMPVTHNCSARHYAFARERNRVLDIVQPTLVLADIFSSIDALDAVERGIRVAIYSTVNDAECARHRPILRGYRRPQSLFDKLLLRLDWLNIMWIRDIRRFFYHPEEAVLQFRVVRQIRVAGLRLPRYSFPGFCFWIDPIVLGPRALSYDTLPADRYFGACVGPSFGQPDPDLQAFLQRPGKTVYASFGSLSQRYPLAKQTLQRIARALRNRPDRKLIIQAGAYADELADLHADNIIVKRRVDQVGLLAQVDAAIIHGGFGSFKECVATGAPFLACPFFYDQLGNAQLAKELGIGDRLDAKRFHEPDFLAALDRLIDDPRYRSRLAEMYSPERDAEEFDVAYRAFARRIGFETRVNASAALG